MFDKNSKINRSFYSISGIILIFFIILLVNLIFAQVTIRYDITKDKLYSLSESTKKILSDLQGNVTIKVFYSKSDKNMPNYLKTYARRVLDFLSEYKYYSSNKIEIEIYDPKADSEEEEWAIKYGIKGIEIPGTGEKIYFGLIATAADQEEIIEMMDLSREKHLEYDITRIISRIQTPKKFKIGVISSLKVFGKIPTAVSMNNMHETSSWFFIEELGKTYDVKKIELTADNIKNDIDLILVFHPGNLSNDLIYAIDQHVLRGGNLILFLDPYALLDDTKARSANSSIQKLIAAWGVKTDNKKVVVDFNNSTKLRTHDNKPEDNPMWLSLPEESFNTEEIITSKLEKMLLPVAGSLSKIAQINDIKYEPLLISSSNSALVNTIAVDIGIDEILKQFKPSDKKYDLAVKIRGIFKTLFPNGKPKLDIISTQNDLKKSNMRKHLAKSSNKSTIIIVGDSDMLFDGYYVNKQNFLGFEIARVFNDNLNFLLNSCEILTGSQELISIRSRGEFEKPFTKVKELEAKAKEKWQEKEQNLVRKIEETSRKLDKIEERKDLSQKLIISEQQEAEIQKFYEEKIKISKELKIVRRNLKTDIKSLGNAIKFINIFLSAFLVGIAGIAYGLYKRKKSHQQ